MVCCFFASFFCTFRARFWTCATEPRAGVETLLVSRDGVFAFRVRRVAEWDSWRSPTTQDVSGLAIIGNVPQTESVSWKRCGQATTSLFKPIPCVARTWMPSRRDAIDEISTALSGAVFSFGRKILKGAGRVQQRYIGLCMKGQHGGLSSCMSHPTTVDKYGQ